MNAGGWQMYSIAALVCFVFFILPLIRTNGKAIKLYSDINGENDSIEEGDGYNNVNEEQNLDQYMNATNGGDNVIADDEGVDVKRASSFGSEKKKKSTTMFRLWEATRVTKPKIWLCWTGLVLEFLFLFLLPVTVLFFTGNRPVGGVFLILSVFSFLRQYFNAANILCELGSIDRVDIEKEPGKEHNHSSLKGAEKTLVLKARLSDVIGNITRSGSVGRWMWFFGVLIILTFFLFSAASTGDDGLGDRPPIVLVDDYYYPGEPTLQYPTCTLSKNLGIINEGETFDASLRDYSFLSALAYEVTDVTGYLLPQWFGEGKVVDEDATVRKYRVDSDTTANPIYFKLFTFPDSPDTAVVAIRGSQTSWDWMVNMQLWSAAGLAQIVKWMTPYGWLWDPILDRLVSFVNFVQADSVDKVSYYTVTTDFVNEFKNIYDGIRITGASLGGGLAIITGAQSRRPAVAISGLGAELSRHTLKPPISVEDINEWVFNWIPDRDYIARLGGRPRQHQEAQCSAPNSDLFGCHSMWRSACEINYRCGTNGRPVVCRCVFNFGYPEPEPVGTPTRTFKEACFEAEQAFLNGTGSSLTSGWWDSS
jgi:lipase ATG15